MTLIDTGTETAGKRRSRAGRRLRRRSGLLQALEDLGRGRVGLPYLPGAGAERIGERQRGRP